MDKKEFKKLASSYSAVPVFKRLLADILTPVSLFKNIRKNAEFPFLLESVEGGEQLARYSFIGRNPYQVLDFDGESTYLTINSERNKIDESYFDALERLTTEFTEPDMPELPRLRGGAVGYSSYDTIREIENLPDIPEGDLDLPEAVWAFYDEIFAFDHVKHQVILIKTVFVDDDLSLDEQFDQAQSSLNKMEMDALTSEQEETVFDIDTEHIQSNLTLPEFSEMIRKSKEYIYEGDIFQVVLSQRFETTMSGDPFMLYRALRMVNPSPYLFYLDFHDYQLVGSSPEVLVRVQDTEARLLPIAGTRPRGKDHAEDLAYEADLLSDPKEIAEHIMLVDLGRNDLSRVCEPGSVILERNQVVERYSHVMHIVSDVVGKLSDTRSSVDALKQCFPAGTVSGAPKIRAMEIIDELEPTKRGTYAGAVGYFDLSGNMDTCIAIRTMVVHQGKVYIQAGAGIVADSDPQKEYEETENKAGALIQALSIALDIQ